VDADGDGLSDISTGEQFKEAADDFVYVKDGLTYNLYFDMNVDNPSEFIATTLTSLAQRGYDVTDVYFFDHCSTDENGDFALEFGDEVWGPTKLQAVGRWINFRYPNALPADCTLHFRHCYVASDQSFLEDLASWFGRDVTGVAGSITDLSPQVYDPEAPEIEGPDYTFNGDLWRATPGKRSEIIWRYKVPAGWTFDPFPWYDPTLVPNPERHGY